MMRAGAEEEETMTREEARTILKALYRFKIKTLYAHATQESDRYWQDAYAALFVLYPSFEYPDWDYRTVGAFLKEAL